MFRKIKFRIMSSPLYWALFKFKSKAKYKVLALLECDLARTLKFITKNPKQNLIIAIRHYKWRIKTKLKYR
jgi:hypothetical protein